MHYQSWFVQKLLVYSRILDLLRFGWEISIPKMGKIGPQNNLFLGKTWVGKIPLLGIKWDLKNPWLVLVALSQFWVFPKKSLFKPKMGYCTFLDYGGLLATILKDWKNAILQGNQAHINEPMVTELTVGNVSAKCARLMFAEKSFCPRLTEPCLREQTFTPGALYELPFQITIENKRRNFQFKLIHNILPTSQCLWKMNVKFSLKCEQCDALRETLSHIFYESPVINFLGEKS